MEIFFIASTTFAYPPPISWEDGEPLQPGTPVRAQQISQLKSETEDAISDCGLAFDWSQWSQPQQGGAIYVTTQINLIRTALRYLYSQKLPGVSIPGQDVAQGAAVSVSDISNIRGALNSVPLATACAGPICGNNIIEPPESCDPPDGINCDATCQALVPFLCGNGAINPPETCDPPNGAECNANCYLCGNSILEPGEQCDDGGTVNGDGCSSTCQTEAGPSCGNNIREGTEECDGTDLGGMTCVDQGYNSGYLGCYAGLPADGGCSFNYDACSYDSCWSRCTQGGFASSGMCPPIGDSCQPGWQDNTGAPYLSSSTACPTDGMICCCNLLSTQYCFDGIQNYNELGVDCGGPDCADCCGNTVMDVPAGETGIDCGGSCPACCGNWTVNAESGEQCDDGNTDNGDGCSSTCQNESCVPTACEDPSTVNCGMPAMRDDCGNINPVLCAGVRGTNPSICGTCGPPVGGGLNICCTNGAARCGCSNDPTC